MRSKKKDHRGNVTRVASIVIAASVLLTFMISGQAQQQPADAAGTWHVAIGGWGIEDHMLVLQQDGGVITGKFEFADVKGTISGEKIAFSVTTQTHKAGIATFQGTVSRDRMEGTVTKGKDSPLPGRPGSTRWIARRGEYK